MLRSLTLVICLAPLFACSSPRSIAERQKASASSSALIVQTDRGPIQGKRLEGNVRAFLGIPYAAAPKGALRWRPPEDMPPWNAPLDATRVGPACPQMDPPEYARVDEDCLSLNVWVPVGDGRNKPVLVWIPGGAFAQGSGGYQLYDGARLAARADAVVMTMNYRVGALGFMAHKELAREMKRGASPSFGIFSISAPPSNGYSAMRGPLAAILRV